MRMIFLALALIIVAAPVHAGGFAAFAAVNPPGPVFGGSGFVAFGAVNPPAPVFGHGRFAAFGSVSPPSPVFTNSRFATSGVVNTPQPVFSAGHRFSAAAAINTPRPMFDQARFSAAAVVNTPQPVFRQDRFSGSVSYRNPQPIIVDTDTQISVQVNGPDIPMGPTRLGSIGLVTNFRPNNLGPTRISVSGQVPYRVLPVAELCNCPPPDIRRTLPDCPVDCVPCNNQV